MPQSSRKNDRHVTGIMGFHAGSRRYLHVVLVPIVRGRGVRLWDGLDGLHERFTLETVTVPSGATHLFFTR